jgi:hypothetical protein
MRFCKIKNHQLSYKQMIKNYIKFITIIFVLFLLLGTRWNIVQCCNGINDKRSSSPIFSVSNNSGNSFERIQIFGSSDLIPDGAFLQFTALDNGETITSPILRFKESTVKQGLSQKNNDSIVNLYTVLPIFYDKPMEDRQVKVELISYGNNKKWPIKIIAPAYKKPNNNTTNNWTFYDYFRDIFPKLARRIERNKKKNNNSPFLLKGLKPTNEGTYDNLYNNFMTITEAHANIYGFTIAEIKSKQPSELPDYVRPLLVSINLLDSLLHKEQLIKIFGLGQEGSEDWKIFEAILSQIGLAKRYDDIALSLKNESYLKDDFHFEPLIKMRGGPNAGNFLIKTNSSISSILPDFFPPKTPEDLDKCMKMAIRTKVFQDSQDDNDVYLKTAEALITIGKANPHPASVLFKAADFFIELAKVRNKLLNSILPSEISKIEGELFQNEFHEEGPDLIGLYRNIKITATNDGLSADDIKGIIEIIDPASYITGKIFSRSIKRASASVVNNLMSDADLTKYATNILEEVFNEQLKNLRGFANQGIDYLTNNTIENTLNDFSNTVANFLKNLEPFDRVSFGPFDITDKKWIDVKTVNENTVKVNENAKTFKMVGFLNECDIDPWLSFHIKSGKFPRSRQIDYNVNRNDNYSLVLTLKLHPIKITADLPELPEASALSTMAGRCRNNAYHIEVEPGETKTFTVDVISAVDDRISAIAERGGMVEIVTNHGKSNYDYLTTKTTYTLEYSAPEDKNGFIDAIRIESLSVSGLREILNSPVRSIIIVVNIKDMEEQYSCSDNTIDQLSLMRMVDHNPNYNGVISICYDEFLKKTHILPANIGIDYANTDSTTINLFFSGSHKDLSADDFAGVNLSGLTINNAGVIFGGMMKVEGKIKAGQRNYSNRALIMMSNLQEYVWFNETKRVRGPYGPGMVDIPKSRHSIFKQSLSRRHFGKSEVSITISKWSSPCHLIGYFHGQVENVHFSGAFKIKLPSDVNGFDIIWNTQMDCFHDIIE